MRCKTVRKESSLYIDGRLEAVTAREMEAHLAECADCAQYVEDVAEISRRLRELPKPTVPPTLLSAVLEAFGSPDRTRWGAVTDQIRRWAAVVLVYPRAVSSAVSFLVTALLFIAVLSVFKPIPEPSYVYYPKPITFTSLQFDLLNGQTARRQGQLTYAFPRVQESRRLGTVF